MSKDYACLHSIVMNFRALVCLSSYFVPGESLADVLKADRKMKNADLFIFTSECVPFMSIRGVWGKKALCRFL